MSSLDGFAEPAGRHSGLLKADPAQIGLMSHPRASITISGASGFPVGRRLSSSLLAALQPKPGLFSKRRLARADAGDIWRKA